jgi:hypothetical protein
MYSNTPVYIIASDSRKRNTGWYGILTGIIDEPTKLTMADDIDPSKLHGNLNIKLILHSHPESVFSHV